MKGSRERKQLVIDHNYRALTNVHNGPDCNILQCTSDFHLELPKSASRTGWKDGWRFVDLGVLLDNLQYCSECRLGPLTRDRVVGELGKGLGGFLYVRCQNIDCGIVNHVP